MKKAFSIVIAILLIFVFASCKMVANESATSAASPEAAAASPEPSVQLPNPVVEVDGSSDFAGLGFIITPYQTAKDVRYSIIGGTVAQIIFTLDGESYTYRAARTTEDISGVYETFDEPAQPFDLEGPDFTLKIVIQTINGGANGALAKWDYDGIQYSFYSPDPTDYDEMTDVLLPILYVDFPFVDCCG
ncbi:MAG: hypothetical protein ABFD11_08225 [Christensenella sp.]